MRGLPSDPALKNLREWVALLLVLFLVLDVAGVEYRMRLAGSASSRPDPSAGAIVAFHQVQSAAAHGLYVTVGQITTYYGLLGAAGLSLVAALAVIVIHGVRRTRPRGQARSKGSPDSSANRYRPPE